MISGADEMPRYRTLISVWTNTRSMTSAIDFPVGRVSVATAIVGCFLPVLSTMYCANVSAMSAHKAVFCLPISEVLSSPLPLMAKTLRQPEADKIILCSIERKYNDLNQREQLFCIGRWVDETAE